ncbi:hypothetical protein [Poseidonibacter lekithochrous]|uniref:hypothetical protein n=1 Tax=Poseidonibacter lekithochrous TaxID=1904463 RepID=UPI0008FC2445|nr:hypothetical protein [Poseidonibacter lekithochrous]QKJ22722.1 hypothetical protein ALEK_1451 [Poseidonibacter lekithochrous]
MNKISKIKKISLSTVLISVLAGCGGGGGGGEGSSSGSSTSSQSVNFSKNSVTYDSCVDLNLNLTCEEGEKNLSPSSYPEIAVTSKENDGKFLLGPAGTQTVSAESTLIYNEMKYNPLVENNETKAKDYIKSQLNSLSKNAVSSDELLTVEQSKNLEESIKDAIAANPLINKNSVIAAVCEKFLKQKTKVSVSSNDISKQTRVLTTINPTKLHEVNWENETTSDIVGEIRDSFDSDLVKAQGGERIVSLHGNGNYQVAASQYHNALTVIDFNQSDKQHQYEKFAAFRTYAAGQGGTATPSTGNSSSSAGGSTGGNTGGGASGSSGGSASARSMSVNSFSAQVVQVSAQSKTVTTSDYTVNTDPNNTKKLWEHLLEDAKITKDGKYVYALIRSKDESVKFPDESTYGLFRTEVGPYGVYPYNSSSTLRIHSKDIKKFELANSDNKVIIYGQVTNDKDEKQNILRVYDKDFNLIKALEIDNLKDFTITSNDNLIVGQISGDYINKPKLVKLNSLTLENKQEIELPLEASQIFTYAHGTMALTASKEHNKIVLVNLESMKIEQEKTLDIDAQYFAMSKNGKYLAVASEDKINIYNLSTPELTFQASIEVDITNLSKEAAKKDEKNTINNLSFVGDTILSYTQKQKQNAVVTYDIVDSKVPMTMDNKLNTALATLDKYSVNNGYSFSEVKTKLNLIPSYKDVNFTWSLSGLQSNINIANGEVTRDVSSNNSGKLIVTASTTFRDSTSTKVKQFDVTILKDSPKITSNVEKFSQLDTAKTAGIMSKVIANSNGSTVISYSALDSYFKGYNLFKVENDKLVFTDGNENNTNRLLRDDLLNMTFKTDEKVIVVTVNSNYPTFSSIYLQDVQSDNTLEEGYNTRVLTKAHIGNKGTPLAANFTGDKNKVFVIRKHFDFDYSDYYADIYKISGNTITKEKEIKMKSGVAYVNTKAPAINNDGSIFYQVDKNNIYKHQDDLVSSVRIDNVIAVYYFNNRVYATTSNGIIVSYNEKLEADSRQEFNLGNEGVINNLEYRNVGAQDYLYAFASNTNSGVYIIKVNGSNEMSEFKYSSKDNTKGGTVSQDGTHIFTYENVPTAYQSNTSSNLSYSKSN